MDEPSFLVPGGGTDTPGGHIRAALLVMVLAMMAASLPFLLIFRPPLHQVPIDLAEPCGDAPAGYHRLEIDADGSLTLDGARPKDLIELRMGLELISVESDPGLALRPHPELPYRDFLDALATTQRAGIWRLHFACVEEF